MDQRSESLPELMSITECAHELRIARSRAYAMAAAGELPGVIRIGRSVRVSRRRLEAWIDSHTSQDVDGFGLRRD
jgi:excisionase family DNA binding protein